MAESARIQSSAGGQLNSYVLLAWLELEQRVVDRRPARPPANDDRIVKPCAPPATCFGFVFYYTPDVR